MPYSQKIEYRLVRENEAIYNSAISSAKDIVDWWKKLEDSDTEKFITICLDGGNRIICFDMVTNGTVGRAHIHIREVFKSAILTGAVSIIVVHNHPSGKCKPSSADTLLTKNIQEAGELLGVSVLDHIIIGVNEYYSFLNAGIMGGR